MGAFLKITLLLILGVLASEAQDRCTGNKSRYCFRRFKKYCSPAQSNKRSGKWVQKNCCALCGMKSVDGNWSEWKGWSPCTVTCGGGSQVRTRSCTDPAPKNGGNACRGNDHQSRACSFNACPVPVPAVPVVAECKDVSRNCGAWADKGECFRNQEWMMKNCKRSCSSCPDVCEDHVSVRNRCPRWAARKECLRNEKWMTIYCRKSCDKCVNKPAAAAAPMRPEPRGTPFDTLCADERNNNGAQCTITSECIGNGMTNYSMEVIRPSKYTYSRWRTEHNKCSGNDKRVVSVTPAVEATVKPVVTDAPAAAPERPEKGTPRRAAIKGAAPRKAAPRRAESLAGGTVAEADSYEARCVAERKKGKSCEIYKKCHGSRRLRSEMVIKSENGAESTEWKVDIVKDCDLGHFNSMCNDERKNYQATCTFTTECQNNGYLKTSVSIRRKSGHTYSHWRTDHTNCT